MDSDVLECRTREAPRGTGPGPDQITYEIVKLTMRGRKSWQAYCVFLAAIVNGHAPRGYIQYLNHIPIVARRKPPKVPGGADGIRPRGGPPCHTRLLESALVRQARPEFSSPVVLAKGSQEILYFPKAGHALEDAPPEGAKWYTHLLTTFRALAVASCSTSSHPTAQVLWILEVDRTADVTLHAPDGHTSETGGSDDGDNAPEYYTTADILPADAYRRLQFRYPLKPSRVRLQTWKAPRPT